MGKPLNLLLVEDSENDALLLVRYLRQNGYDLTVTRVDTAEMMQEALAEQDWDIIIADYVLPHFSGLASLEIYQAHELDIPFILVSGTIGEALAVTAIKSVAYFGADLVVS